MSSIYLSEEELALLAAILPGQRIEKLRARLPSPPGVLLTLDRFEGALEGLVLLDVEFESEALMAGYAKPDYAAREVTDDPRYGGAELARHGLPGD